MGLAMVSSSRVSPISTWGGGFVLYALASLLWTSGNWLAGLAWLASFVIAFAIGRQLRDTWLVWLCYNVALILNLCLVPWLPYGAFGNPNYLGCALALGVAGAIVHRQIAFFPFLGVGLFYTGSRGAILAAGAACMIALWRFSRMVALPVFMIVLIAAIALSHGRDNSMLARIGIWHDTMTHASVFGTGWGSYAKEYFGWVHISPTEHMSGVQAAHAYNDFLEIVSELGLGSVALWVFLLYLLERQHPERLIAWTFFLSALTFFPLHVPIVGQLFALTLGHIARSANDTR